MNHIKNKNIQNIGFLIAVSNQKKDLDKRIRNLKSLISQCDSDSVIVISSQRIGDLNEKIIFLEKYLR